MLEDTPTTAPDAAPADAAPSASAGGETATVEQAPPKKKAAPRKAAAKKAPAKRAAPKAAAEPAQAPEPSPAEPSADAGAEIAPKAAKESAAKKADGKKPAAKKAAAKKTAAKKTARKAAPKKAAAELEAAPTKASVELEAAPQAAAELEAAPHAGDTEQAGSGPGVGTVLFQAPEHTGSRTRRARKAAAPAVPSAEETEETPAAVAPSAEVEPEPGEDEGEGSTAARRRRRRGGRRRRKPGEGGEAEGESPAEEPAAPADERAATEETGADGSTRRRRRRRRTGEEGADGGDEPGTVTRVRQARSAEDQITAVSGSTRLEAKKQRRREGREAGRRRAPIVSEAEFLARRESVERVMVIRQREDLTQIAVLEDKVLVEHYVARESQTSLIGNVYLGRVQNVLPSMEAAFIDIGKGRNAVLYAGEVNWSALGHKEGQQRKIESVLTSGQSVLVQVTKDPVGHKGARLTSQISLAGRFLVYVPDGTTSGISRKLPDTERNRLKTLLKEIVPDTAGVIVRTAAEGASEDELTRDVERLKARWEVIEGKAKGSAPQLLYGEPDLTLKVVRDLFTEDFASLVIEGDDAWDTVQGYVSHVAPDLEERLERYQTPESGVDVFAAYRIDEQIAKGLDRKVWLPSGGSLVIDRTEAMTVVDVNTGKFTGSGGNLEETVTKNNLEAAEEIVRQLRLRDIGGIIVVDFIDMVLESNRDLVLRRLVECLGRDRTRHQVAEVTSLGLVQMTRKRIGTGLLEAFSHTCDQCGGRGLIVSDMPVEPRRGEDDARRTSGRRTRGGRGRGVENGARETTPKAAIPSPRDLAAVARPDTPAEPVESTEQIGVAASEEPVQPVAAVADPVADTTEGVPDVATVEPESDLAPAPVPEPVVDATPAPEPEPVVDATPEPAGEVEPTPEPEPVRVVTRSRRRSASRPAGPPVVGVIGEPPLSGSVEPGTGVLEPGTPEPAGAHPGHDEPHVEHVPIKKKGTRKR